MHHQDYLREAILDKRDQSGFCEDGSRFYWLAIRRQDKIKLQKRAISVVKTPDKKILICKDSELSRLSGRYIEEFIKERRKGDKILLSPALSKKEKHFTYETLGLIPKEPFVKRSLDMLARFVEYIVACMERIVGTLIKTKIKSRA